MEVFWRIGSSEPASYTVTLDVADVLQACVYRISDFDAEYPINNVGVRSGNGSVYWQGKYVLPQARTGNPAQAALHPGCAEVAGEEFQSAQNFEDYSGRLYQSGLV